MGQIMGVGTGVFIILFFGTFLGIVCIAASRTKHSRSVTLVSVTFYAVMLMFLLLTPRTAQIDEDEEVVYNNIGVLRRFLIALMAFMGLSGISALASDWLFTVHVARSITYGKDVTQIG